MRLVSKKYLWLSFSGHIALFGTLLLFHTMDGNFFSKKTIFVPSLKVTMTALPEKSVPKIKQQPKKPPPLPIKKEKPLSEKKPKPEKDSSEKSDQKDDEKTQPKKPSQNTPEEEASKGNQPSQGLSEGEQNAQQIIINEYLIEIVERIKRNWNLPKYLTDHSFRAELEIKINSQGKVTEKTLITPSQNEVFNGKVLKAIELSSPFPPPPEPVRELIEDGIVFQLNSRKESLEEKQETTE